MQPVPVPFLTVGAGGWKLNLMVHLRVLALVPVLVLLFVACPPGADPGANQGDPTTEETEDAEEEPGGAEEPEGPTVPVTFTIDDSANQVYLASDGLAWKGSFSYDSATGVLTRDDAWSGPYPLLYDDGTHGDETPGDHVWTVTALVPVPDTGETVLEYGAVRFSVDGSDGEWIWPGANGSVTVPAGATDPITAAGLTLPAFGTVDLRFTLNTAMLAAPFDGTTPTGVSVKSELWGWSPKPLYDDGTHGDAAADDQLFSMQYSLDQSRLEGLPDVGDEVAFMIIIDGAEYKSGTQPLFSGVRTYSDWHTQGDFLEEGVRISSDGSALSFVVGDSDSMSSLFFSEYVEGSSYNKGLEIYNAGPHAIDLSSGIVNIYTNGSTTPTTFIDLSGQILSAGDVLVIAHPDASFSGDIVTGYMIFNGDDVIELVIAAETVDVIGQIGSSQEFGKDITLRRNCTVTTGDPDGTDAFDVSLEFTDYLKDAVDGLGSRGCE